MQVLGMLGEIVGYVAHIAMHSNPFTKTNFLMYLVTLTIAPAFLSAAIYLCLARIVVVYGEEKSRFLQPRTYTIVFCTGDFLALLLQAIGGGIASGAASTSTVSISLSFVILYLLMSRRRRVSTSCWRVSAAKSHLSLSFRSAALTSVSVSTRSLAFQGIPTAPALIDQIPHPPSVTGTRFPNPLTLFGQVMLISRSSSQPISSSLPKSLLFRSFLAALCVATVTIFIRSVFRVAELSGGFHGPLANHQISFMILEGAMVCTACLGLTLLHPGLCFQGEWRAANFTLRGKKLNSNRKNVSLSDLETEAVEPPHYSESMDDMGSVHSGPLDARIMTATHFRPGEAHLEMVPIYGIRYENTSDEFPRPRSG